MYSTPTLRGGSSSKRVRMGKKAASVFPEAVEAVSSTLSSVPKMASPAAFCTPPQGLPAGAVDIVPG